MNYICTYKAFVCTYYVCIDKLVCTISTYIPGLYLGNNSRRGKIKFYESKGGGGGGGGGGGVGDGIKIHVHKHTASRGVWGMPPQEIFVF